LAGGGAITSYHGAFGFMGFFILRPEFRGRGYGNALWHARRERLIARLRPGATIGLDGVFTMQDYYAKGGFVFSHRNMRFRAEIPEGPPPAGDGDIVPLAAVPFDQVLDYDRTCFPALRPVFLKAWIAQPDSLALGCHRDRKLLGYGVARRCRDGCKIGPLFLDAPENNLPAMELVRRHAMTKVFGCARMYLGPPPDIAHGRIFGVTTFELG
jgi:hypothetical protein